MDLESDSIAVMECSEESQEDGNGNGQQVFTTPQLSKKFNVSTKTIDRWRKEGDAEMLLESSKSVINGKRRVVFFEIDVIAFVTKNPERVNRASGFSQMTDDEIAGIINEFRLLLVSDYTPPKAIQKISKETMRSIETIRYTLRKHDRENPENAVFPEGLSEKNKMEIYKMHLEGKPVEDIASTYKMHKSEIFLILRKKRIEHIESVGELPLDFMPNDEFSKIYNDKKRKMTILDPMPASDKPAKKVRPPAGLSAYLASLYEEPLLTREQEAHLFRKLNFAKYKAAKLRGELDDKKPSSIAMRRIEKLYRCAVETKNELVRRNLRLVVSIAKRHVGPQTDFYELISDGNMTLIRAVEKFDFARGNRFSTYATWALMRNYSRSIPQGFRQADRFRTGAETVLESAIDTRGNEDLDEEKKRTNEEAVKRFLSELSDRERHIIVKRTGMEGHTPMTLKEIAGDMGVTKERVRQIEVRAMFKLRQAAEPQEM